MSSLIALLVAQVFTTQGPFTVASASRLWIEGGSNFKAWSCEAKEAKASLDPSAPGLPALSVQVPIAGFHCNEDLLDGKLRDALKADRFPEIAFSLESEERLPGSPVRLRVTGALTLAGQTGTVSFIAEIDRRPEGVFVARGSVPILMSSYDVEPPTAMLGLIRASDLVTVKFDVQVTPSTASPF